MTIRASYQGGPGGWKAVIRAGKKVVWKCDHFHRNRDQSSVTGGQSACHCASLCLRIAQNPEQAKTLRDFYTRQLPASPYLAGQYELNRRGLLELEYAESVAPKIQAAIAERQHSAAA